MKAIKTPQVIHYRIQIRKQTRKTLDFFAENFQPFSSRHTQKQKSFCWIIGKCNPCVWWQKSDSLRVVELVWGVNLSALTRKPHSSARVLLIWGTNDAREFRRQNISCDPVTYTHTYAITKNDHHYVLLKWAEVVEIDVQLTTCS